MNDNSISTESDITLSRKHLIAGIVLVVLLPYICLIPYMKLLGFDTTLPEVKSASLWISRFLLWGLLGGFFIYSKRVDKSPFLLWPERKYAFWMYIVFFLVTFFTVLFSAAIVSLILKMLHLISDSATWEKMAGLFRRSHLMLIFTCVTAGVTEELMFRGFLQPRLELLFKNRYIAIFGSALFFALIHFGFGTVQNVVGPFVIGLIFAIHYSYFRNIKFLIVFHILWDLMAVYLVLFIKGNTGG